MVMRVGQLDGTVLDGQLAQLLQEPLDAALALVSPARVLQPELTLLIQLTLYRFTVWHTGASYGASLQDLTYVHNTRHTRPSRPTLVAHASLTLVLPYLHARLRDHALSRAWPDAPSTHPRRRFWNALHAAESVHTTLALLNFLAFLANGRYSSLTDRLLRMSLVPSSRVVRRDISYEFMNRQMVWHAFTEFLLFLLPLINARLVRRRINRLSSLLKSAFYSLLPASAQQTLTPATSKRGKYWLLSEDQCAICAENAAFNLNISEPANIFTSLVDQPTTSDHEPPLHPIYNPYQASCGHIYCYACIAERMIRTADEVDDRSAWECLRCAEQVTSAQRFRIELEESEASGSVSDYDFSSDLDLHTDLSGSMGSYSESGFSE